MCQLAGVSRAGFYRSLQDKAPVVEEMEVRDVLQRICLAHRHYGSRRIGQMLRRDGLVVNRKRVQRLMRNDNLLAVARRKFVVTTDSGHKLRVFPNLAKRLTITAPNQLWVADLTYVRLQNEFVYLAVVLDVYSRKVIGWALGRGLQSSLVVRALTQAMTSREVRPGLVHHSDRGVQYASYEYVEQLEAHGIWPSMSRPGNPYDNAKCESFMRTLKREQLDGRVWTNLEELEASIAEFIDGYYNQQRLHSALEYLSPVEFEQQAPTGAGTSCLPAALSFPRHKDIYPDAIDT